MLDAFLALQTYSFAAIQLTSLTALFVVTLSAALPLLLAGLGGLYSERSGIINIGLEGMMLGGAFAAGVTSFWLPQHTILGPWLGLAAAGATGLILAGLHAYVCIHMRSDQIISGVAINILVAQGTVFLSMYLFGGKGGSPQVNTLPEWAIGPFTITPILLLGVGLLLLSIWSIWHTPFGLRLRACGEHPKAAQSAGISVQKIQFTAVLISGLLAGLGGAVLLNEAGRFGKEMTAGRGYIALAALIFGGWKPIPLLGACLFFGCAFALKDQLSVFIGFSIPSELLSMLPYIVAMLALCGFVGKVHAPASLGKTEQSH